MTNSELLAEMRGWIYDCFEDAPDDLTDAEVLHAVGYHYVGGTDGFKLDGFYEEGLA